MPRKTAEGVGEQRSGRDRDAQQPRGKFVLLPVRNRPPRVGASLVVELGTLILATAGIAQPALAQGEAATAAAQNNAATSEVEHLEEVVVTAQHRAERLQDVPISAQVLSGDTLIQQNMTSLNSVGQLAPSVHVGTGARSSNLYIRGVGSGPNQSFDQSVGVFVDDIYHGRSRITSATFLDLERLEILKGPQSTFFGNNAIAGAFNIVTAKPTSESAGWVRALGSPTGGTNGGQYAIEGAIGAPISDAFAIRAAATYNGQRGWLENVNTGDLVPREENAAGRVTLRFAPNETFDVTLKVEAGRNDNEGGLYLQNANCPPPAPFPTAGFCNTVLALGIPTGLDNNQYSVNDGSGSWLDTGEAVLTADYQIGGHTVTAVSGYYDYDFDFDIDTDGTPVTLLNVQAPERYHQFSQELRVASATGQPLEYLAGIYFQDDHLRTAQSLGFHFLTGTITGIPAFAPLVPYLPLGQVTAAVQGERVYSAFGSLTWNATDRLKLSAGVRASWVEKDFDWSLFYGTAAQGFGTVAPLPAAVAPLPGFLGLGTSGEISVNRNDDAVMPSARIQYQLAPSAMTYASYSRGFKAGGFNVADTTAIAANLAFEPEHVDAYELGLKSEWLNRTLLVNLAVFRSEYTDLQVSINQNNTGAVLSLVRNAAESTTQGVELETQWIVNESFRLAANLSYLDSKYDRYPNAGPTNAQKLAGLQVQDLSGHRTPFAPEWSGGLTGTYSAMLPGDYRFTTELTGSFRTRYDARNSDDPFHAQGGYTRLDARLTFENADRRWAFDVIGRNLTDRVIFIYPTDQPASLGSLLIQKEQPRNIALQARYHW